MKLIGGSKTLRPPPPPRPVIMALLDLFLQSLLSNGVRRRSIAIVKRCGLSVDLFIRVGNGSTVWRRLFEAQVLFRRAVVATQVWVACRCWATLELFGKAEPGVSTVSIAPTQPGLPPASNVG